MKHIKNEMQGARIDKRTHFFYLIERLVRNIPEQMFFNSNSYTGLLKQALYDIVSQVNLNWVEVRECPPFSFRAEMEPLQDTKTF